MQITIINDCCDENAKLRQISRAGSLIKSSSVIPRAKGLREWLAGKIFGFSGNLDFFSFENDLNGGVNCFGVRGELEAAGFLVDTLDALEGREGIVLVNVAPRGGKSKKWENGTPFGYFRYGKTLVFSSVDGLVLSLAKKLNMIGEFYLVDIASVLNSIDDSVLDQETKDRIIKSQFRSFDFLPRFAAWVFENKKIPVEKYDLGEIAVMDHYIWFIDNFGNIKTTILKEEISSGKSRKVKLKIGNKTQALNFYDRLKDIPDGSVGLVVGSSGIGNDRFMEIIFRGGNAAKALGIKPEEKIVLQN